MTAHHSVRRGHWSQDELCAEVERARDHVAASADDRLLDSFALNLDEGMSLTSPAGVQLDVNAALCAMTGYTREELIGRESPPYWPPEHQEAYKRRFRQAVKGKAAPFEATFVRKGGERFSVSISPSLTCDRDGRPFCVLEIVRDMTELRRSEGAIRCLNRELRAITSCNQVLVRAEDEVALLGDVCRIIRDEAGYGLAWVGYAERDEAKTVRPVAWAGVDKKSLIKARISWADSPRGRGPTGTAIRSGESVCVQDLATDSRAAPWRKSSQRGGYRACLALPLKDGDGGTFGAISIYAMEADAFTPDEMRLLEGLAGDLAFGIVALRARDDAKQAEEERLAHVRFLESMELIDRAIRRETDVEHLLQSIVETVFSIFAVDRAWLLYPCDPDAPSFRVPVEVCRHEYPGASALNREVPMGPSIANSVCEALASDGPVTESDAGGRPVNAQTAEEFGVQAQMFQAIYPRVGKPWVFGVHQCSHARIWTEDEKQRFTEVGRRVADGLSNVLIFRDLKASEQRYRTLVENAPSFIVRYDGELRRTYVNPAWEAASGLSSSDIVGVPVLAISEVPSPADEEYVAALREVLESGTRQSLEFMWENTRGEVLHLDYVLVPERDEAGDVVGVVAIGHDVTERRMAAERLEAAAAEWRATFDAMSDAVALFDADGRVMRCNGATCELAELAFEDILGRPCYEVFHRSDEWHRRCPQVRARASGRSETAVIRQDGRWLRVMFQPLVDAAGENAGGVHVVSDISELKQAEQALRASESRFRSLFEDAPIAEWEEDHSAVKPELERLLAGGVHDIAAHLRAHPDEYLRCLELVSTLDVNRAAAELFAANDKQALVARSGDLHTEDRPGNLCLFWAALLAGERSVTYEETGVTLDRERVELLETCTLAPGSERSWERVYIIDADITPQKQAELQLQQSLTQLQAVFDEVIAVIAALVEARDPYTAGHQQRVGELAAAIASQMGLGADQVTGVHVGALLHDVGKITVPAEILTKPAALTAIEFQLIKAHPQTTHDLLEGIEFPWPVAQMALQHHERLDGSGYPAGLAGDEILVEARILAVADVVEAMASHRPYRPALGIEAALAEVEKNRGRLYDPAAVGACLELFRAQGFAFTESE